MTEQQKNGGGGLSREEADKIQEEIENLPIEEVERQLRERGHDPETLLERLKEKLAEDSESKRTETSESDTTD